VFRRTGVPFCTSSAAQRTCKWQCVRKGLPNTRFESFQLHPGYLRNVRSIVTHNASRLTCLRNSSPITHCIDQQCCPTGCLHSSADTEQNFATWLFTAKPPLSLSTEHDTATCPRWKCDHSLRFLSAICVIQYTTQRSPHPGVRDAMWQKCILYQLGQLVAAQSGYGRRQRVVGRVISNHLQMEPDINPRHLPCQSAARAETQVSNPYTTTQDPATCAHTKDQTTCTQTMGVARGTCHVPCSSAPT